MFLNRIGPDGITLTQAGYLPPAVVAEMRRELPGFDDWPATSNRESDQRPVHLLREYAKTLGLVRKYKGKLIRTNLGSATASDAGRLWAHLLDRLPLADEPIEREAGYLVLLTLAAGTTSDERRDVIAEGSPPSAGRRATGHRRPGRTLLDRPPHDFVPRTHRRHGRGLGPARPADGPVWGRLFAQMVLSM